MQIFVLYIDDQSKVCCCVGVSALKPCSRYTVCMGPPGFLLPGASWSFCVLRPEDPDVESVSGEDVFILHDSVRLYIVYLVKRLNLC